MEVFSLQIIICSKKHWYAIFEKYPTFIYFCNPDVWKTMLPQTISVKMLLLIFFLLIFFSLTILVTFEFSSHESLSNKEKIYGKIITKTKTRKCGILHIIIFVQFGLPSKLLTSKVNSMFVRRSLSNPRKKWIHSLDSKFIGLLYKTKEVFNYEFWRLVKEIYTISITYLFKERNLNTCLLRNIQFSLPAIWNIFYSRGLNEQTFSDWVYAGLCFESAIMLVAKLAHIRLRE